MKKTAECTFSHLILNHLGGKKQVELHYIARIQLLPCFCTHGVAQKALDAYSSCLEWIADNNLTIRRDVLEGMARCCTKLGQKERALDLADILVILL